MKLLGGASVKLLSKSILIHYFPNGNIICLPCSG